MARKMRDLCWCLTVVVVSDNVTFLSAFAKAADDDRLLVWSTKVLVVTNLLQEDLDDLLASHWAYSMMNVLVVNVEEVPDRMRCGVWVHMPYSLSGIGHSVRVASWTPELGLVYIGSVPLFPEKAAKGWLLMEAAAQTLNFTIRHMPTRDWIEVMDLIKNRSAYISPVAYVIMPHQLATVDYTVFIEPDTLTFSMATPSLVARWQNLYYPMTPLVWCLVFMVLLLLPFSLFMVCRLGENIGNKHKQVGLMVIAEEVLATFLGQSLSGRLPTHASVRLMLGTWLMFVLVVSTAYRGNLTASLIIPKYPARVETLSQLIEAGVMVTVPKDDGDDLISFFKQSGSRDFQVLAERAYKVADTLAGLIQATQKKEAYVYVRKLMEALIAEHLTDETGGAQLYVAQENISPGFAAWPIIRDAPFKPALDRCIVALTEAGLTEKWMSNVINDAKRNSRLKHRVAIQKEALLGIKSSAVTRHIIQALTLTHLQGPFFLLLLGLLLSFVSFTLEILLKVVVVKSS
ncbi:Ionotropic receptor 93a-like 21 [Homarus americanus]|uniref:Ionotropic receptor 93a-like 21 n=1 Tax=Homarus americanus TaxID=6706 RepID=A0A8J5JM57_HOMAM|nr:Ionotropic receptor 93a-like 21 [Homarus americanus]